MEATIAPTSATLGFSREAVLALAEQRGEPDWLRELRLRAWDTYESLPMPTRSDEEWRRTDLRGLKLDQLAPFSTDAHQMLAQAMGELGLSARAYDKIRRVARTIADLDGSESIEAAHVAEAVSYRLLDRKV